MSKRVLVTGGAGYLGSTMVPALLDAGHQVTVLDSFMYKQASLAHVCANPDFHMVRGDVRNKDLVSSLLASADVVIPLAALVGAPLCDRDPIAATTTNKDAVIWMFEQLSKDQLVIMPTTNSAYGKGESGNFCDENSPLFPISLYAKDKVDVEKALMERENSVSFRLATVFGMSPRMRLDLLVNDFVYRAVNDRSVVLFEAHFKRNYIHVRDVANAFLMALNNTESMCGEVYNVGLSEANLSKYELCERIKESVPEFVIIEAGIGKDPDQRDYIVSNEKIEKAGFAPQHSLELGIKELIKGYQMIKNSMYGNV